MIPQKIRNKIAQLYGQEKSSLVSKKLFELTGRYDSLKKSETADFLSEQDIMLITYADNLKSKDGLGLSGLTSFTRDYLTDLISMIHILPFCPYSSDDGFSVMDYRKIKPEHGNWSDIAGLNEYVDLCFDQVLNHASAQGTYFQGYLKGDRQYENFFIESDPNGDYSSVVRPRTWPLIHEYASSTGQKWCWTTFSDDQVDLNFENPNVLLEMIDVLLFYVRNGARMVRLDAIAYLWKTLGTSCVHLPQTHTVVQLMRDVLDIVAPHVLLLTETNFPHEDNMSYFGDGHNEAQVVYNFPMPPLVLHSITAGNADHLTHWAQSIQPISDRTTFLNFTASHDGIGVRPAATILDNEEFEKLVNLATAHNGQVSSKADQQGNPIPYELNINYFDALNDPNDPNPDENLQIDRFLLSQSIALTFMGIPAVYIHSLIGSRNWTEGVTQTGHPRTINREKLDLDTLIEKLQEPESLRAQIFNRYTHMIAQRRQQAAFHPNAAQEVLNLDSRLFTLARTAPDDDQTILAIHNVSDQIVNLQIDPKQLNATLAMKNIDGKTRLIDLISQVMTIEPSDSIYTITLKPYQFLWLTTIADT